VTAAPAGRPATAEKAGGAGVPRLAERLPEPAHLWIRFAPRGWEGPERPWLDLAAGRLGRSSRRAGALGALRRAVAGGGEPEMGELPGAAVPPLDDVLYLPPVPERLAGWRDAMAERALAGGTPVLVQLLPGDETSLRRPPRASAPGEPGEPGEAGEPGAVLVLDLLAALLPGGDIGDIGDVGEDGLPALGVAGAAGLAALAPLAPLAPVAAAVWPLLRGITDDPRLWERYCERLAAAGLPCLQALVPAFGPGDRRRLAQGQPEGAFAALFHRQHGQPPAERDFARVAHRRGLAPFLPRPLPRLPLGRRENRRIAGQLALIAELWLRLGRPVEQAQSLFRAARWLDATAYDAGSLSREGNLGVVTALDPLARRAADEAAAGGEPALLGELMAEYLGP
jgi:hypothetical protein